MNSMNLTTLSNTELADLLAAVTREMARRKPHKWLIYRYGNNTANQPSSSCAHRVQLGRIAAESEEEALQLAHGRWTCYNNQILEAVNEMEVLAAEARDEALTEDLISE